MLEGQIDSTIDNSSENEDDIVSTPDQDMDMETLLDEQWNFSPENTSIKTATPLTRYQQRRFSNEIAPLANKVIAKSLKDLTGYKYS